MDCTYCAAPATDKHHVLPLAYVKPGIKRKPGGAKCQRHNAWLVPACRECNSMLGARMFSDPQDGTKHVARQLKRKYWRLLKARRWTDAEIDEAEIKGSLKRKLRADMAKRDLVEARIVYAERMATVPRPCAWCKEEFSPNQPYQRFCRDRCRAAYHRARTMDHQKHKGDCWATGDIR